MMSSKLVLVSSAHDPILGEIPGIDFLRSLAATKVGNPEDIVFGKMGVGVVPSNAGEGMLF